MVALVRAGTGACPYENKACLNAYKESVFSAAEPDNKEFDVLNDPVIKSQIDFLSAADSAVKKGGVNKDDLTTIFNFQAGQLHDCMTMMGVDNIPAMPEPLKQSRPTEEDCVKAIHNLPKEKGSLAAKAFVAVGWGLLLLLPGLWL